jgi:predicted O-methyltransferase YrrM
MGNKDNLSYEEFHQRITGQPMQAILNEVVSKSCNEEIPLVPVQAAILLFTLTRMALPKRILELGTGIGYSTLLLALASTNASISTIERNPQYVKIARQYFEESQNSNKIKVLQGDALKVSKKISDNFDFVFLDAAKEEYLDYLRLLLPKLSVGAAIIADDIFFTGETPDHQFSEAAKKIITSKLKEFRNFLRSQPFLITSFLPIDCGVSITFLTKTPSLFRKGL